MDQLAELGSMDLTCLNTDNVPAVQHLVSVIQAQMRSTTSPMFNTCITVITSLIQIQVGS